MNAIVIRNVGIGTQKFKNKGVGSEANKCTIMVVRILKLKYIRMDKHIMGLV